jgi:hypothetical protein
MGEPGADGGDDRLSQFFSSGFARVVEERRDGE